jgi:hypothetical protein
MATDKHALYLVKEGEGSPRLFHGDDVEAAKANGWSEPEFPKSNGTQWNAEDDLASQDAAARLAKKKADADAKKSAKAAKAEPKADAKK